MKKISAVILTMLVMTFVFAGCGSNDAPGNEAKAVQMATKPMTEQFILSEMLKALVEANTDITIEITKGIAGGTGNIHPALIKGEFDLYPEYTGTAWNDVLKKDHIPDDQSLYDQLTKEYQETYGLEWVGLYGFNNTYGLALREEIAEQYKIETYSDLATISPQLSFGAEYDFYERQDGYDALCAIYGLEFAKTVDLDIGIKYTAINQNKIDAMNVFTTDGQLNSAQIRLLKDDKNFYQTYYCGTVVRQDALAKYPELAGALMLMDGIINEAEMAQLNFEVEENKREDKEVAREFLQQKGLL